MTRPAVHDPGRRVYADLDFDMVGSPNCVRFVYDGDRSDTGTVGPAGSEQIEAIFDNHFAGRGLETDPSAFDGRSRTAARSSPSASRRVACNVLGARGWRATPGPLLALNLTHLSRKSGQGGD